MKPRIRKAILQILLLQEEFSSTELSEAVRFISKENSENLLDLLSKNRPNERSGQRSAAFANQQSHAVSELKDTDPEKHQILSEFDALVRKGELLPSLDSIKKIATELDKNADVGKTRKEAIPKLIHLLSNQSIFRIQELIGNLAIESKTTGNEYESLANFIIHGKKREST